MKKLSLVLVTAIFVFVQLPLHVSALSDAQKRIFGLGINYYDVNNTADISSLCSNDPATVSSETGTGPLFGLNFPAVANPQDLVIRINNYLANTQPSSPLMGLGADFVAAGQKHNVNPAMIVGFAFKESSLGMNQPEGSYDAFGLTQPGDVPQYPFRNGIIYFPSWQASIDPEFNYVYSSYIAPDSTFHSTSVGELMTHYTPPNAARDTRTTLDVMHKILDGIATTGTGGDTTAQTTGFSPGSTSANQCAATGGYQAGANGYDLAGTNVMAHFYQDDPKWGGEPYGAGKTTIGVSGCGITSLAMVVDTLTGRGETPLTLADKYGASYHIDPDGTSATDQGTSWSLWPAAANDYNLEETDLGTDLNKAAATIRQGGLVIISVSAGYFTTAGHLMVIRAVDGSGNFYLADPNGDGNKNRGHPSEDHGFSASFLRTDGNMVHIWGFAK
jgi:hypothetical protein